MIPDKPTGKLEGEMACLTRHATNYTSQVDEIKIA